MSSWIDVFEVFLSFVNKSIEICSSESLVRPLKAFDFFLCLVIPICGCDNLDLCFCSIGLAKDNFSRKASSHSYTSREGNTSDCFQDRAFATRLTTAHHNSWNADSIIDVLPYVLPPETVDGAEECSSV